MFNRIKNMTLGEISVLWCVMLSYFVTVALNIRYVLGNDCSVCHHDFVQ
jgi:hypothetical protein